MQSEIKGNNCLITTDTGWATTNYQSPKDYYIKIEVEKLDILRFLTFIFSVQFLTTLCIIFDIFLHSLLEPTLFDNSKYKIQTKILVFGIANVKFLVENSKYTETATDYYT